MSMIQFRPVRGYDRVIQEQAIVDGNMYLATDTGKIYVDAQGERVVMGGNGVGVFYAKSFSVKDRGDNVYIMWKHELEEDTAQPRENDLIINIDGKFFKILAIDYDTGEIQCLLLAVSGSGGGGGNTGGSTMGGSMTLNRLTPLNAAVLHLNDYTIGFSTTAVDSAGDATGNGRYEIWLNGKREASGVAVQGDNYVDVGHFLKLGLNVLTLRVYMDIGTEQDTSLSIKYNINATALALEWNYNELAVNDLSKDYTFEWKVSGANIDKTTHIIINDNYHLTSPSTESTGVQTMTIKPSDYGSHGVFTVSMYVTSSIIDEPTPPKTVQMIFRDNNKDDEPIVGCGFYQTKLQQYDTVKIPVFLFDTKNTNSTGVLYLKEDGIILGTISNMSNLQWETFNYTPTVSGVHNLTIQHQSGQEKRLMVDVTPLNIDVNEVAGYAFKFKATEFANNEAIKAWNSNGVTASFNDFDWINGGLTTDSSDGIDKQCLYIKAGSSMTINYELFKKAPQATGKSFKIIFKTTKCRDYDAKFLTCSAPRKTVGTAKDYDIFVIPDGTTVSYSQRPVINADNTISLYNPSTFVYNLNDEACRELIKKKIYIQYNSKIYYCKGVQEVEEDSGIYYVHWYPACVNDSHIGLEMCAQNADYNSETTFISTPYCEDTYIDFEVDIDALNATTNKMYIKTWMDGIPTSINNYGEFDIFTFNDSTITIGSEDCDVCVYLIRAYEKHLTDDEHLANFIADAPNASEMMSRYRRNDILDPETQRISPALLATANPNCKVHVYDISRMTLNKNDKIKNCSYVQYYGSGQPVLTSDQATIRVQGTSSAAYGLAAFNLDTDFTVNDVSTLKDGNGTLLENGWSMNENSIPCTYFTTKVNVASVEQANNALNQEWYNAFQPYKSVLRCKNPNARDTMEFTPGVLFIADHNPKANDSVPINNNVFSDTVGYVNPDTGFYPKLYSVCNMGNSKKNIHVCHDLENPLECCVEVSDNQTPQQWMTDDTFAYENIDPDKGSGYTEYYSFRYPDGRKDVLKLPNGEQMLKSWKDFVSWMAQSNPQPMYNTYEDIQSSERFDELAINPETMQPIDVYVLTNNEYVKTTEYNEEIHTYYTKTANKYGYTNLALPEPKEYAPYTFKGFKTGLTNTKGELWQKDYTPIVKDLTITRYANTYTHDTYEYRMAKMLAECEDHLIMDAVIYHYLFVERHCLIDNIAKNTFWFTEDGQHWAPTKDYDNDTSDGNDNNGKFTRNYGMECLDKLNNREYVFNARQSVWLNFIHGLPEACRTVYNALEGATAVIKGKEYTNAWSAENYLNVFKEWQATIPERCWIEGYYRLYERPHKVYNDNMFLSMMNGGKKTHQRHQYETYQNYYISSKYYGTEASSARIVIRGSGTGKLNYKLPLRMYADCYIQAALGSGNEPNFSLRTKRKEIAYLVCPLDDLNNVTFYLYLAPMYSCIGETGVDEQGNPYGNLSGFALDQFSTSNANKLRKVVIGTTSSKDNSALKQLGFENNELLEEVYAANCSGATLELNLRNAPNLKFLDTRGSGFTSIVIADGAPLEELKIASPNTLVLSNLTKLRTIDVDSYAGIRQMQLTNIDTVKNTSKNLIDNAYDLQVYLLKDVHWELDSPNEFTDKQINIIERLKTLSTPQDKVTGLPQSLASCFTGLIDITSNAYSGNDSFDIYTSYVNDALYPNINLNFQDENAQLYDVNIYTGDGTIAWTKKIKPDENVDAMFLATGPKGAFSIDTITKMNTMSSTFTFTQQWEVYNDDNELITIIDASENDGVPLCESINSNIHLKPLFEEKVRTYTLTFYDVDGNIATTLTEQPYGRTRDEFYALAYEQMTNLPYKDDSGLDLHETYSFDGYGLSSTSTNAIASNYTVQVDQDFYPIFTQKSVYDNVLGLEYLTWYEYGIYAEDMHPEFTVERGATLSVKPEYKNKLRGKVTLPTYVPAEDGTLIPVIRLGSSCFGYSNIENTILTHVFFEQAKKETLMREIGSDCFRHCGELRYVELPVSLRRIGDAAFQWCHKLSLTPELNGDLTVGNNIYMIESSAFSALQGGNNNPLTSSHINITIGSEVSQLHSNAFLNISRYFKTITIGSPDKGTKLTANNIDADCFRQNSPYGPDATTNCKITIYITDVAEGEAIVSKLNATLTGDTYSQYEILQTSI